MNAKTAVAVLAVLLCAAPGCNSQTGEQAATVPGGQKPLELTDANFDETIKSGVTLVDFWAPWCGPCRTQGPIVDKIAETYGDKATVGKLNVDDNADTARRFGVQAIPTLIIFKDGKNVKQFVGVQSEAKLKAAIDEQL